MTETQVNIPLLRKAVEWAEGEAVKPQIDRQWRQCDWQSGPLDVAWDVVTDTPTEWSDVTAEQVAEHCGTAYCIAGWVGQALDPRYAKDTIVDGVHVAEFAADALGLPDKWSEEALFNASNTIADIRRIAEDTAGERL